jgi:Asp-tRNA(Asn)/Glu-tRNA(Gln) amidotransferase C subunit
MNQRTMEVLEFNKFTVKLNAILVMIKQLNKIVISKVKEKAETARIVLKNKIKELKK